jgi:uncharacterized protein with FMN-binding domain
MPRGLVALSASAVAAIYMAGYLRTQSADASIGAAAVPTLSPSPQAVAAAVPPAAPAGSTATVIPAQRPLVQRPPAAPASTTAPTPAAAAAPAQVEYKDGTYTGQGTSRRGDVWVQIEVSGGRISNVTITRSTLQYPLRDIASLPQQVVQRQSAQVDLVSRATYSSMAFRGAVAQALAQSLASATSG